MSGANWAHGNLFFSVFIFFSKCIFCSDYRGYDQTGAGAVGRAEEVHGEGQVPLPHLAVLPQEDHPVCGHQDVHLEPGGGPRHGASHHLHPHPGSSAPAQTQCPEQVPASKCGANENNLSKPFFHS